MSARLYWTVQEADGDAVSGVTVTVHDNTTDALLATMTNVGDGSYYADLSTSGKVKIKENGVVKLSNYWHAADDMPTKTELASTSLPGTSLVHHATDFSGKWTATSLYLLLSNEIPSLNQLGSTDTGKGASLVGVEDVGGYYSATDIEALLQEIGARMALLSGLTANAAELNKLDGTSGDVTSANLNALVAGTTTELHKHAVASWFDDKIGNFLNPGGAVGPLDFRIFSYNSSGAGPRGKIILDVYDVDGSGRVVVRKGDDSEVQTDYDVITSEKFGDFDLSSNAMFSGITTNTAALLALANSVRSVQTQTGINYTVVDFCGTNATTADGNAAADPTTTVKYNQTGISYVLKRRTGFVQKPEHRFVSVWVYGKFAAGASTGSVKVMIDTAEAEATITSTTATLMKLTIDLSTIKVTKDTERSLLYYLKGDATLNASSMMEWIHARAEI